MPVVTKDYVKNLLGKVIKSAFPNKSSLNKISESDGRMLFDGKELAGAKGDPGAPFTYDMFTSEQLEALKGPQGPKGDKGDTGSDMYYSSEQIIGIYLGSYLYRKVLSIGMLKYGTQHMTYLHGISGPKKFTRTDLVWRNVDAGNSGSTDANLASMLIYADSKNVHISTTNLPDMGNMEGEIILEYIK